MHSFDFSFERLVLGKGAPLSDEEMEVLAQESEDSKGVTFDELRAKLLAKSNKKQPNTNNHSQS